MVMKEGSCFSCSTVIPNSVGFFTEHDQRFNAAFRHTRGIASRFAPVLPSIQG